MDADLLKRARDSVLSTDGPSIRNPGAIREAARQVRKNGLTGFVPSFEPMSYISPKEELGNSALAGKRLAALGFEWLREGESPFKVILARVQRLAFKEFVADPELKEDEFRDRLGAHFFGSQHHTNAIPDLLFLQDTVNYHRSWTMSSPAINPEVFELKFKPGQRSEEQVESIRKQLWRIQEIATRYKDSTNLSEKEIHRIALYILNAWEPKQHLLRP